jgi:pantoate--beta-alanine ligase
MSSRNVYLSEPERAIAPALHHVLQNIKAGVAARQAVSSLIATAKTELEQAGFKMDYLVLRDAVTLGEWHGQSQGRLLVAAWLGKTRLIDNIAVDRVDTDRHIKD